MANTKIPLIKNCPNCDALIPIESQVCSYCDYAYPILELTSEELAMSHTETVTAINNAFFRLERYMDGKLPFFEGFPFAHYLRILFHKTKETANYTQPNCQLIGQYWWLIQQVVVDIEKGDHDNYAAEHGQGFEDAYSDLKVITEDFLHEFLAFATDEELAAQTKKHKISDIVGQVNMKENRPFESRSTDLKSMPLKKFFKKIKDCRISELEILNHVEYLTEMKPEKLKLLLKDFDVYFYPRLEEEESKYTHEDIEAAVKELTERHRPIPQKSIPDLTKAKKGADGKFIQPIPTLEILDIEKLLFPFKFYYCRQFSHLLEKQIAQAKVEDGQATAPDPLRDSLYQLGFEDLDLGGLGLADAYSMLLDNDLPFRIAFLYQTGLIEKLERTHARTKAKLYKILANALNCPERAVKGNLNVLNALSKEDRRRYTAHLHVQEINKLLGK